MKRFPLALLLFALSILLILFSCSNDSIAEELCNIKLVTENSREMSSTQVVNLPDNMEYKAEYLGNSNHHHYGHTNGEYRKYSKNNGILLSQGPWRIYCRWLEEQFNSETGETAYVTVAKGDTRSIWVNLNTESLLVYLDEDPVFTDWSLSYAVNSKSLDSPYVYAELYRVIDHVIEDVPYSTFSTIDNGEGGAYLYCEKDPNNNNNSIYTLLNGAPLSTGRYILKIYVKESSSSTEVLFTDVLGFVIRNGHKHHINGNCTAEKESTGSNEYIHWEDNPSIPTGSTVEVGGGTSTGTTESRKDLNQEKIKDKTTYIVYETETGSGEMNLGHSDDSTSNRIVTPVVAAGDTENNFAIDMKGTNVSVTTSLGENTTIIQLNENITMNLFNSKKNTSSEWGASDHQGYSTVRTDANVKLNGGTINIIGNGNTQKITSGSVVFTGPSVSDSYTTLLKKQGAINLEGKGGDIVMDGVVTVQGLMGISSFQSNSRTSSLTNDPLSINISMFKSKIQAQATSKLFGEEVAYGIYLDCSENGGVINITLDSAIISSKGSNDKNESAIRIDNFTGAINITIKDSTLSSEVGKCISLNNCRGSNIVILDNATLSGPTALNISGNTKVTVTKDGGTPKTYNKTTAKL